MEEEKINIKDILDEFGESLINDIKAVIPRATGRTADSLELETTEKSLIIKARPFIWTLEYGRGKTGTDYKKGNVRLIDAIKEWIQAKGITSDIPLNSWAYAISNHIHKRGYEGHKDIFTKILLKNIDNLLLSLGDKLEAELSESIIKTFKI
jgi:hypothetical protein